MNLNKLLIIPAIALCSVASAQTYSYSQDSSHRGWVDENGYGSTINGNYISGSYSDTEYRNYFNFDFSGVVGLITQASLTLDVPANSYGSTDVSEIFALSLVDTTVDLSTGTINDIGFFNDLGDGSFVGSAAVAATTGGTITINLSQDFIDRANQNGTVTIGGSVLSLSGTPGVAEYIFGNTQGSLAASPNPARINLTVDPNGAAVPEPSSTLLISLAGIGFIVRRKR